MASTQPDVAAWTRALERCVTSRSHALVDDAIVLVFVDAPRVFHPAQALVQEDDEHAKSPLVVVLRLHPTIASFLQSLTNASPDAIDIMLASVLFRERPCAIASSHSGPNTAPCLLAPNAVNLTGGALCLYGETPQSASHALALVTRAIKSCPDRLAADVEHVIVVVEHCNGYVARDFVIAGPSLHANARPALPRLMTIQKCEWGSLSIAQLSLDDALEEYEAGFIEEQEINGLSAAATTARSLSIHVNAAFEVREKPRSGRGSAFLLDVDDIGGISSADLPQVVLMSQWEGLENVRSLLCKPPPQSASTLCFSSDGQPSTSGPRQSLSLLQHLDHAIRNDARHTWKPTDVAASEILQTFKNFLKHIDQDDFQDDSAGGDDTLNNTIESTVSMVLDGERQRAATGPLRAGMDPVEKLWHFLTKHAYGANLTQQLLQEFMVFVSNTRMFPAPHPENDTELAKLIRLRHDEVQGNAPANSFASAAQQQLKAPADAFAFLIQAGEWKMKRDVAHALNQAGFSSQECSEFVLAMPRFDVNIRKATYAHWRAMDHVLQLCTSGQSIQLPVSYIRKAVHDCVAYHARNAGGNTNADPLVLVDLQSFVPDRLRSSIADYLYWDMIIAFNGSNYEHRLHICQDPFHPTVRASSSHPPHELVLDDTTLRALHRNTPEEVLLQKEVVQFMTKLEDAREKRVYEQLHDIDIPSGVTRYDCTIRRLPAFP